MENAPSSGSFFPMVLEFYALISFFQSLKRQLFYKIIAIIKTKILSFKDYKIKNARFSNRISKNGKMSD